MAGATRNCCRLGASSVYTIQPCTMSLHASHIRKMYACLAVTCHLHFWQNDRGLLRATAVTVGCGTVTEMSQHRKLTLEKKILPPLLQGFEPAVFRSRLRRSVTTELSPLSGYPRWAIPKMLYLLQYWWRVFYFKVSDIFWVAVTTYMCTF